MIASWVIEESKTVDLEDERLNKRYAQVLDALGKKPSYSIPAACGGFNETTAAYRFFDNKNVTFEKVLKPHCDATRTRMAAQPVAILAQDTTEIDVTRPEQYVRPKAHHLIDDIGRRAKTMGLRFMPDFGAALYVMPR